MGSLGGKVTGHFWLDWVVLAVSLFNALILLWLGLTVFFTAEQRVWGIWLSSGGLLLGAIFFISHSIFLSQGINTISPGLNFWWRFGWIPVAALPFMWYTAILWYAGYWDHSDRLSSGRGELYRRQRWWFSLTLLFALYLMGLLGLIKPLPSLSSLDTFRFAAPPSLIPLVIAYQILIMVCIGLSIDALRQPEISGRLLGEIARARARRWLIATSLILLGVSLLVGWVVLWIVNNAWRGIFQLSPLITLGWFDLCISILIAISVLLLGQAVVAYEVFTGKTLPRRGLKLYWRRAVILIVGFSFLVSGSLTIGFPPIYTLLLSVTVMVAFFALLGWRVYAERERLIKNLRPFAASQKMVDSLLKDENSKDRTQLNDDLYAPFFALCVNVLETDQAGLFPIGSLALMSGQAMFYPPTSAFSPPDLENVIAELRENTEIGLVLNPNETSGLVYAVPLWRDKGLIGVIFLGQKQEGRPYTQEEIEIAQVTGERLIDAQVSAEITRRLISLQRRHKVAGQVIDQRVRRRLHDEILPQVHTAILDIVGDVEGQKENGKILGLLEDIHNQLSNMLHSMPPVIPSQIDGEGLVTALRHSVDNEMKGVFDEVIWQIQPRVITKIKTMPPLIAEVVYSAAREGLRNAARHGRGGNNHSRLCLHIAVGIKEESQLFITLEDNGVGIDREDIFGQFQDVNNYQSYKAETVEGLRNKGAFGSGYQQEISLGNHTRNGHGLALHSTLMAVIGGSLTVSSSPGQFTRLTLELPFEVWGGK